MAGHRAVTSLLTASLVVAGLASTAGAGTIPGGADLHFGGNGRFQLDEGRATVDSANAFVGNLVVGAADGDMALATFDGPNSQIGGGSGRALVHFDQPSAAYAVSYLVADIGLAIAGRAGDDMAIAKTDTSGELQPGFGAGGRVNVNFGLPATAYAVTSDPYNRVLAAGQAGGAAAIVRRLPNGDADPSFGTNGAVLLDLTAGDDVVRGLVRAWDGETYYAAGQAGANAFVAHITSAGQLDPSFGTGGVRTFDLSPGRDAITSILRTDAGGLMLAGVAGDQAFIASMRSDGSLDPAFATAGVYRTKGGGASATFNGLTYYGAGPIVGLVAAGTVTAPDATTDVLAVRLTLTGAPDPSFSGDGIVVRDLAGPDETGAGITVGQRLQYDKPDTNIRLASSGHGDVATEVLNPDGSSWDNGPLVFDFGRPWEERAVGIVRQPDGKLVVLAHSGGYALIVRLTADGVLDASFRPAGPLLGELGFENPMDLAVDPAGRILVLTMTGVYRFTTAGELDASYGSDGHAGFADPQSRLLKLPGGRLAVGGVGVTVLTDTGQVDPTFHLAAAPGRVAGMAVQADGKLAVAFAAEVGDGSILRRFNADGSRDPTFLETAKPFDNGVPSDLLLLPDGRFVIVGMVQVDATTNNVMVSGYRTDGFPDENFASGRSERASLGSANWAPRGTVGNDGSILVGVSARNTRGEPIAGVARFGPSGHVDLGFGTRGVWTAPGLAMAEALTVDPRGGIVIAGSSLAFDADLAVIRYTSTGGVQGAPRAWGWNGEGELGVGSNAPQYAPSPLAVSGAVPVTAVSAGWGHSLAVRDDGIVEAWGWNPTGQVGDGTTTDRRSPVTVPGLTNVVAVAAGIYHSLALRSDGTVWAWGWNGVGQLGDGTTSDRHTPVQVPGLSGVTAIAAGGYHSLALRSDGTVWAWGWNALGQLGDTTTTDRHAPVMSALGGATRIAAGTYHSLAVATGDVLAWGWNGLGQVAPAAGAATSWPTLVSGVPAGRARDVAGGLLHSLAVTDDGRVWAWGWNGVGQLGDGTTVDRPTPVPVTVPGGALAVVAGADHSLAVTADNSVFAWGWNGLGQLGDATTITRTAPVRVAAASTSPRAATGGAVHSLVAG